MRLVQFVDNIEYATSNCWQKQLLSHLKGQCDEHHIFEASNITNRQIVPEADIYLSTLKARTVDRLRLQLSETMKGRSIHIYDQDPWESFIDTGTIRGAYHRIVNDLNVKSFILTSKWWADYVASRGFKTRFTQMWMNELLCDHGVPWDSRPITIGFKGALHPHRKKAIDELAAMGVDVQIFPPGSYDEYLNTLSQMQFFFHEEASAQWTIDGQPVGQNALWAKEIEIASRGCFALRRHEPEAESYELSSIPSIMTYDSLSEVPEIIRRASDDRFGFYRSQQSVRFIRQHRGWFKLTDL